MSGGGIACADSSQTVTVGSALKAAAQSVGKAITSYVQDFFYSSDSSGGSDDLSSSDSSVGDGNVLLTPTTMRPTGVDILLEEQPPDPEIEPGIIYAPNYVAISPHWCGTIELMCHHNWDVPSAREFQVQAIHRGAYHDNTFMSVTAKTGYGKSLIPSGIMSIRRGVGIVKVPLLGLGTDQVAKAMRHDKNIEARHVDEFFGKLVVCKMIPISKSHDTCRDL
jgi:hypothetical protein